MASGVLKLFATLDLLEMLNRRHNIAQIKIIVYLRQKYII